MNQNYIKSVINAFLIILVFTVILGIIYPLVILGIGQVCFPYQANGSLVTRENKIIGSMLIQQKFTDEKYFHGRPSRPSSVDTPTSREMVAIISTRIKKAQELNKHQNKIVPLDLVTDSGSGIDPEISPDAAYFQAKRISDNRNIPIKKINLLIKENIKPRQLGILGQNTVNVLALNLALDKYKK